MTTTIYVSADGLLKLRRQADEAELAHRKACEESARACELSGDGWHDNPYFNHAQQVEAALAKEVVRLRALVVAAVVLPAQSVQTDRVGIGSVVEIAVIENSSGRREQQRWQIVGYGEGDKASRRIAYTAPVVAAILGARVGDIVEVTLAGREAEVEITALGIAPKANADASPRRGAGDLSGSTTRGDDAVLPSAPGIDRG